MFSLVNNFFFFFFVCVFLFLVHSTSKKKKKKKIIIIIIIKPRFVRCKTRNIFFFFCFLMENSSERRGKKMSNVILTHGFVSAETQRTKAAPSGLRGFQTSNQQQKAGNRNPILKPRDATPSADIDADAMLSPIDRKLKEFQRELIVVEGQQKRQAEKDDQIVERRMAVVQQKQERLQAAIDGVKLPNAELFDAIPHSHFVPKPRPNKQQHGEEGNEDDDNNNQFDSNHQKDDDRVDKNEEDYEVAALRENVYSEAYRVRIEKREAVKQEKQAAKDAAKEKENAERKRKGALANLALKMKQNPERFAELQQKDGKGGQSAAVAIAENAKNEQT